MKAKGGPLPEQVSYGNRCYNWKKTGESQAKVSTSWCLKRCLLSSRLSAAMKGRNPNMIPVRKTYIARHGCVGQVGGE